ncbi:lipocalin family protein [uncultured Eudoraea sp.]|uniref:lipocalin family protein n=1 Tax=uncultured Eudoraea sp. TaxID=1035614 RepID=UPI002629B972|nr:lipocalin family protein [uncultured Eudoraea sp.]
MKRNLLSLFIATALLFSCSSDKDDTNQDNDIIGSWDLTALEIDDSTASDDEKFARDILNFLSALDCSLMTITFNADQTVITENSGNYLDINVNTGGTGLDVPCPTEKDTSVDNYLYEGGVLTYIDENEMETTVSVTISGNTMRVNAVELDFANFDDGGELIFTKR